MKVLLTRVRSESRGVRPFIEVPTNLVQFKCYGFVKSEKKKGLFFRAGVWDENKKHISQVFEEDPRYLFYQEHVIQGIPLKDTRFYSYHIERQEAGRARLGFETEEHLIFRLKGYVSIFKDIEKAHRVTPAYELKGKRGDEIGCVLGRGGEILKLAGGNNRFAIAKILQLPTIPIQIYFMHMDFLDEVSACTGVLPGRKINSFLTNVIGAKE